jgi:RAB protein geranylgeranyltransferase component A
MLDTVGIWEEGEAGLTGKVKRVPGSKEEIFKDKSISLLDKRRLMKFFMFAVGDFETDKLLIGTWWTTSDMLMMI